MRKNTILGMALAILLFPSLVLGAPVEQVNVSLRDSSGKAGPLLLQRMQDSLRVVAEQLLLRHDTERLRPSSGEYERLLREVADRALSGYQVDSLNLHLGSTSQVQAVVSPWSRVVRDVDIDLHFSGVVGTKETGLLTKLDPTKKKIKNTLQGASIDAVDWAGGLVRQIVREDTEKVLPDFRTAVDLSRQEDKAVVQVVVYPVGQIVQDLRLDIMSDNLPNVFFIDVQKKFREKLNRLRGLPVKYLQENRETIQEELAQDLRGYHEVVLYGARPAVSIIPGPTTRVTARLDSPRYKVWFEGYADLGRDERNISGKAHIGKYISKADEIFAEGYLEFNDFHWGTAIGYMRKMGDVSIGYARRLNDHENNYRFEYNFAPRWRFRAEHISGRNENEFALRYRVHEFLSLEYVYSNIKPYFRIVGNL